MNDSKNKLDYSNQKWPALPSKAVKSAGRALQILEYFDDVRRPANIMEVSRALGYPQSSTSILLKSLVALGYINYDRFKRSYHPTSRVRILGSWIDSKLFHNDAVLRLVERVNTESSDTVILASHNDANVQYIHVAQAHTALRLHVTIGTIRPISSSIIGYALMSQMDDSEIKKLTHQLNFESPHSKEFIEVADVLNYVSAVRREGYAFANSKLVPGSSVLSMPLPSELTSSPLAITIGGTIERMTSRKSELIQLLKHCINEELAPKTVTNEQETE